MIQISTSLTETLPQNLSYCCQSDRLQRVDCMNDCHGNSVDLLRPDAAYMCTEMICVDSAAALSGLTEQHNALMMYKKIII